MIPSVHGSKWMFNSHFSRSILFVKSMIWVVTSSFVPFNRVYSFRVVPWLVSDGVQNVDS